MLYDPAELFPGYTIRNTFRFTANAVDVIAFVEPRRIALTVYYISGTTLSLSPFANVTQTTGIQLTATIPQFKMVLALDGAQCSQQWYAISAMGGCNYIVFETLFDPGKVGH